MKRNFVFFLLIMSLFSAKASPLTVGTDAPKVSAPNQDGTEVDFAATYAKGPTLVYFYPKADTPGCTAQACSLRDNFATLSGKNLQIVGVSNDSPAAQKKFQEKYNLPFALVSDTDGRVASAFGVPTTFGFASRQSFLIMDGKVAWMSPKAKTSDHAAEVQAAIDSLVPR